MHDPKILAVSYAFPPMAYPRSVQVSRLLAAISLSAKIVCGDCHGEQTDETIMQNTSFKFNEIIRIPFVFSKLSRYFGIFDNNRLIPLFNFPDKQRRWANRALKYFFQSGPISDYKPDLMITFSTPVSDHLFGLEYKKRTGVPWIAHFSDPWSDNPYIGYSVLTKYLNRSIERKVIENADAVIFTSPETLELVMRKYPSEWKEKAFYVPHCIDRALYDTALNPPHGNYILRHIGNFYGLRSPLPLYEAIERIGKTSPDMLKEVSFELVGLLGKFGGLIDRFSIAKKVVKFVGKVSYTESLRLMQTAHCLLVIDAPAENSVFFPSKLVDYIGADRFIVALSPEGTVNRVVKDVGGLAADPSDINMTAGILKNVLKQKPMHLPLPTAYYDKDTVGRKMMDIVGRTAGRSRLNLQEKNLICAE